MKKGNFHIRYAANITDFIKNKRLFVKLTIFICTALFVYLSGYPAGLSLIKNHAGPAELYASGIYTDENALDITAEAGLVMNQADGRVLWGKNEDRFMYPASTTKMMTAILAIENIEDFNTEVKISENAAGKFYSKFAFKKGDEVSLGDLLKVLMLESHNGAAIAIAEYVGGSVSGFADMMNEKALEIGAVNTKFENPNGLDHGETQNISTAFDLALIAKYCMQNEEFKKIVDTTSDVIYINGRKRVVHTGNGLLALDYVKGIKTGYTDKAGSCIVTYSDKNDLKLIIVLLKEPKSSVRAADAQTLMSWAENNYKYERIVQIQTSYGGIKLNMDMSGIIKLWTNPLDLFDQKMAKDYIILNLYPEKDYLTWINSSDEVDIETQINKGISDSPIRAGTVLGKILITINGQLIKQVNLVVHQDIAIKDFFDGVVSQSQYMPENLV